MNFPFLSERLQLRAEDITLESFLGSGAYSSVFRGLFRCEGKNIPVAVKILNQHAQPAMAKREVDAANITHENLVRVYGWYIGPQLMSAFNSPLASSEPRMHIVMELCTGGSVADLLEKCPGLTITQRLEILRQTAAGLTCLHGCGIMHRDLKAENLVLAVPPDLSREDGGFQVKITDFGLSRPVQKRVSSQFTTAVGTPLLLAPECFGTSGYTEKVDIFMFGLLALTVFGQTTDPDIIRHDDFTFNPQVLESMALSKRVKKLITDCCSEPDQRPAIRDVSALLEKERSGRLKE